MRRRALASVLALALALGATGATSVLDLSLARLFDRADHVLYGTVTEVDPTAGDDDEARTRIAIDVERRLRVPDDVDAPEDTHVLTLAAGERGGERTVVDDLVTVDVGDRILLAQYVDDDAISPIVGVWQGLWRLTGDGLVDLRGGRLGVDDDQLVEGGTDTDVEVVLDTLQALLDGDASARASSAPRWRGDGPSDADLLRDVGTPDADPTSPSDASPTDASPTDDAPDTANTRANRPDVSTPTDATAGVTSAPEASATDASPTDASASDASPSEASPTDASPAEPRVDATSPTDASATDASPTDASPTDVDAPDASPTDGAPDPGPASDAEADAPTEVRLDLPDDAALRDALDDAVEAWRSVGVTLTLVDDDDAVDRIRVGDADLFGPDALAFSRRVAGEPGVEILVRPGADGRRSDVLAYELGRWLGLEVAERGFRSGRVPGEEASPPLPSDGDALRAALASAPEDLDGDGDVDFYDLVRLAAAFGEVGTRVAADVDGSGEVDGDDVERLRARYTFLPPSRTAPEGRTSTNE